MQRIGDHKDVRYQRLRKQKAAQRARMKKKSELNNKTRRIQMFDDAIRMLISETEAVLHGAKKRAFQKDLVAALKKLN